MRAKSCPVQHMVASDVGLEMEAGTAYLHHHWSIESSGLHLSTESCLCEADVHVRVHIKPITLKHIAVLHLRKVRGRG